MPYPMLNSLRLQHHAKYSTGTLSKLNRNMNFYSTPSVSSATPDPRRASSSTTNPILNRHPPPAQLKHKLRLLPPPLTPHTILNSLRLQHHAQYSITCVSNHT
eukprot:9444532-Pyramimonas_sp.AAC.1